jgi:hypothetical protein
MMTAPRRGSRDIGQEAVADDHLLLREREARLVSLRSTRRVHVGVVLGRQYGGTIHVRG